jgi:flagellar FliL protein
MSAAAAESVEDGEAPAPASSKGKKKLIILIATALLVVGGAGGGAAMFIKKKRAAAAAAEAAAASADGEAAPVAKAPVHKDSHKGPPTFLPLDPFIVNLADRESERFAQIGITLELDDAKFGDQLKAYMPAIRNGVLMLIAHKTSQELLTRAGKEKLAMEILRESVRPMGMELEDDDGPRAGRTPLEQSPVRHVHFSSFIIQ